MLLASQSSGKHSCKVVFFFVGQKGAEYELAAVARQRKLVDGVFKVHMLKSHPISIEAPAFGAP